MKYLFGYLALLISFPSFSDGSLHEQMLKLDSEMFNSFNNCASASELIKHESYFATDVEFYHDNGGVTWDRKTMIQNTKNNVCGKFRRELVPNTFKAFPVKNFGAITQGVHVFCQHGQSKCEGKADFTMVWKNSDDKWTVTRALSYGHRENN